MKYDTLFYLLALSKVEGVGPILAKNLISYCGSAKMVFESSRSVLSKVPGIGNSCIESIANFSGFKEVEEELSFIQKRRIKTLPYYSKDYPFRLKHLYNSPLMLLTRGNFNLNKKPCIAVVGTRKPSAYGKQLCENLIEGLKDFKGYVISGLAYGVDSYIHRLCLENNIPTLGVLAHGLDRIYPSSHKQLAQRMVANKGGLITEFLTGTIPDRENFPKRNRIVAGLCDALIVIESRKKGGSMITAEYAWDYDKSIFVYPGRTSDLNSGGCINLIKQHKASLIEGPNDVLEMMNWDLKSKPKQIPLFDLNSDEQLIMQVLQQEKVLHVEKLVEKSGLNAGKLAYLLLELEFKKMVLCRPGKLYEIERKNQYFQYRIMIMIYPKKG